MMSIHNEAEVRDVRVINVGSLRSLRSEVSGYLCTDVAKQVAQWDVYRRPPDISPISD